MVRGLRVHSNYSRREGRAFANNPIRLTVPQIEGGEWYDLIVRDYSSKTVLCRSSLGKIPTPFDTTFKHQQYACKARARVLPGNTSTNPEDTVEFQWNSTERLNENIVLTDEASEQTYTINLSGEQQEGDPGKFDVNISHSLDRDMTKAFKSTGVSYGSGSYQWLYNSDRLKSCGAMSSFPTGVEETPWRWRVKVDPIPWLACYYKRSPMRYPTRILCLPY